MKNKLFIFILFFSFVYGGILKDYKQGNYKNICNINVINSLDDEKLLSITGISCVKIDSLYLLPLIIRKLKHTKTGRLNSIYLLIIYMQKKLLYSYFFDNLKLDDFELPDTNYILSHVFYKIKYNEYKKENGVYIINYDNEIIKVYKNNDKLFVDEYRQNKLIKRHWYK